MPYKLAIFDFDGTLADSVAWAATVLNELAVRYGFRVVAKEELRMLRGKDNRAIVRHLGVPFWKMPFIANHGRKLASRDAARIPLYPGSGALLRSLAEHGVELAIVSSNDESNIRRILGPENAGLVRYYECGASIFGKASKFRRVLKRSGVKPEDAIAIGDETRDIEAARGERLATGAVTWGYATAELLESFRPTWMFAEMGDIVAACTGVEQQAPLRASGD